MGIFDLFRGRNFRDSGSFDKFCGIYFRESGVNSRKNILVKIFSAKMSFLNVIFFEKFWKSPGINEVNVLEN